MHKSTIWFSLLFAISAKPNGAVNLLILKNADGSEFKVTSNTLEVIDGSNFSLICEVIGKNNNDDADDHIFWSQSKGKIKFPNIDDANELLEYNITDANVLNFTSVSVNDQGKYFCKSTKYGQFRTVLLIVKTGINMMKETNHHYYKRETDFSKILEESEKLSKLWIEEQQKKSVSDEYITMNPNTSYKYKSTKRSVSVLTVVLAVVGTFAITMAVLAIYLIVKYCQRKNNSRAVRYEQYRSNRGTNYQDQQPIASDLRNQQTQANSGGCSHRPCIEYRLQHHNQICLLEVDTPHSQRTYGFDPNITPTAPENNLYVPPAYNNSAKNSTNNLHPIPDDGFGTQILNNADNNEKFPLPPTYQDAVHNQGPQSTANHDSYSSGGRGDTGHTADSAGRGHSGGKGSGGIY